MNFIDALLILILWSLGLSTGVRWWAGWRSGAGLRGSWAWRLGRDARSGGRWHSQDRDNRLAIWLAHGQLAGSRSWCRRPPQARRAEHTERPSCGAQSEPPSRVYNRGALTLQALRQGRRQGVLHDHAQLGLLAPPRLRHHRRLHPPCPNAVRARPTSRSAATGSTPPPSRPASPSPHPWHREKTGPSRLS